MLYQKNLGFSGLNRINIHFVSCVKFSIPTVLSIQWLKDPGFFILRTLSPLVPCELRDCQRGREYKEDTQIFMHFTLEVTRINSAHIPLARSGHVMPPTCKAGWEMESLAWQSLLRHGSTPGRGCESFKTHWLSLPQFSEKIGGQRIFSRCCPEKLSKLCKWQSHHWNIGEKTVKNSDLMWQLP